VRPSEIVRRRVGLTPEERVALYAERFPKFPPPTVGKGGRIEGLWIMGNNYTTKSKLYGAYPHGYMDRVSSMFPDCVKALHLFSGSLPTSHHIRVDLKPARRPDVLGDAHALSSLFPASTFDIIYADPPYSQEDALHYGTPMVNRQKVMEECRKVVKVGGWVIWLDQVLPIFSNERWKWGMVIGMIKSTNHRVRGVFGFQRIA
jgi:hypothetical protein